MMRKNTRWLLLCLAQSILFVGVCSLCCYRLARRIDAISLSVDAELLTCREAVLAVRQVVDDVSASFASASLGADANTHNDTQRAPVFLGRGRGPNYLYEDWRVFSAPDDSTGCIQRVYSFPRRVANR